MFGIKCQKGNKTKSRRHSKDILCKRQSLAAILWRNKVFPQS